MLVNIRYDGISPEDSERLLVYPMEKQLRSLENLKDIKSSAFEGGANITLEFNAGFNAEKAKNSVRDKVDQAKTNLPLGTDDPTIQEINTSKFPVLTIKLSGDVPESILVNIANTLKDQIEENVSEILEVNILGDRTEQVELVIDPIKLENYSIDLGKLIEVFSANNAMVTAGTLDTSKGLFSVKVPGLISKAEDLLEFPIIAGGDRIVSFKDITDIKLTYQDVESYARDRGVSAVALEITKRSGENLIHTVAKTKEVVKQVSESEAWPKQVNISYSQDQTKKTEDLLSTLQNNLILALLFVMWVLVFSMGWRPSILVGLAVPGSFFIGVLILQLLGHTMNMVVLFSFILASGMLVDGAIIVVEYADRRMIEGYTRTKAYEEAAIRMAIPVLSSVGTIVMVFMPLMYWPGIVGEFMKFLPITLIATLGGAIIMALFFMPTLGAMFAKVDMKIYNKNKDTIQAAQDCEFNKITGITGQYVRLLGKALDKPWHIILGSVALLIFVQALYLVTNKGVTFFPEVDPEQAKINIRARGNLSGAEKDMLVQQVEKRILDMKELSSIYANTIVKRGKGGGNFKDGGGTPPDTIGTIFLEFIDWDKRRKVYPILEEIKDRTKDVAGVILDVSVQKMGPPGGKPIEITVSSSDTSQLETIADKVEEKLVSLGGIQDLQDDRFLPGIQSEVVVDRKEAAKYGANVKYVGAILRLLTNGLKLGSFRQENQKEETDIILKFSDTYRNFDELANILIPTAVGSVALSNFAEQKLSQKVGTIRRQEGVRVLTIKANVETGHLPNNKVLAMKSWLTKEKPFPKSVSVQFRGEDKDQKESGKFLVGAFIWAILLVGVILVTQFDSFFSTLLVLSSVIMSTIGVFLGILIHGLSFSIVMGGLGIISLAGVIVSNNIIMIDTFDIAILTIKDIKTAIMYTCAQRLRPIFLTQATVVLGLLPIIFGLNLDFVNLDINVGAPAIAFWEQFAICVVYGVTFASMMTLFATPAALMARHRYREWKASRNKANGPKVIQS